LAATLSRRSSAVKPAQLGLSREAVQAQGQVAPLAAE